MSTPNTRLMAMPWEHKRHRTMRIDFAKGEAITNPGGFDMQLSRPLDFYAVTDRTFLGLVKASAETVTEFRKMTLCRRIMTQ